jgi:malonyl-CoA O-methyltransferase
MFHDIKNALADGGVFLFATLGPQTLLPLQPLCSSLTTPHDFASWPTLVDLGDALVAAGLAKPVLDREILTFTYDTADAALAELARDGWFDAARGAASCTAEAARALTADDGSAAVPFEILYGVAWNTAPAAWQPLHFLR